MLEPATAKVTLIGGEGRECEVNGLNYPYLTTEKYLQYHKGRATLKPEPEAGLWRMELEHAQPSAKRLFVTVLTAGDVGSGPPAVKASWIAGRLVVQVGSTTVRFARVGATGGR